MERHAKNASAHKTIITQDKLGRPSNRETILTDRQREVLLLFSNGMTYKQIAKIIGVCSFRTVEDHIDGIRVKLGARSRRECIRIAIELKLIRRD